MTLDRSRLMSKPVDVMAEEVMVVDANNVAELNWDEDQRPSQYLGGLTRRRCCGCHEAKTTASFAGLLDCSDRVSRHE